MTNHAMRIAFAYQHRRIVGGIETHLSIIIPALLERGHQVAFLHEAEGPTDRPMIVPSVDLPMWSVSDRGKITALAALKNWRPDLLYLHGLQDLDLEARLVRIAPAILFAHGYHGTCVSGAKSFKSPTRQPCDRQFGLGCLAFYFPRRCGGLSPVTMFRDYARQARRLALLPHYHAVLVASSHMAHEYSRHGFDKGVSIVPLPVPPPPAPTAASLAPDDGAWRLLFLGRIDPLKGGDVLLAALPLAAAKLGKDLHVTFAGDGVDRPRLECLSIRLMQKISAINIQFTGWQTAEERDALFQECDLLVVPSLWPEPFGLAGVEAGHFGVPSTAFNVGGISDWLTDGVNGHLAPGQPPTPPGLADAIVACLGNRAHHAQLRDGAAEMARRHQVSTHVNLLEGVFENVLRTSKIKPEPQPSA